MPHLLGLQIATLPVLHLHTCNMFSRATPLPRAPDHQRIVQVIVLVYLQHIWLLWGKKSRHK